MGSYTEFFATDRGSLPPRGTFVDADAPYLSTKYRLPAVWLAMFDVDDLQVFCEIGRGPDSLVTHLATPRECAVARLAARAEWLRFRLPTMRPEWLAQFEAWVAALPQAYVHLATDDVASMVFSIDGWAEELPHILRMFDEPWLPPAPLERPAASPSGGALKALSRWWRGDPAPAPRPAPAAPAASGWERYCRHFHADDSRSAPEPWMFLGSGDDTMPWEQGD